MALIKCPECGREISNKAASCPHCGMPIDSQNIAPISKVQATFGAKRSIWVQAYMRLSMSMTEE